ncbi:MAG: c-type cytochrome [Gallionella sp.]
MNHTIRHSLRFTSIAAAILLACSFNVSAAVDVDAAKGLARDNNCFKCHGVDKEKDGPSYKKVAEKYRGKAEAEAKLIHHITSGEKAKFPDGHEEDHKNIQGKASPEAIKNLVDWILSL